MSVTSLGTVGGYEISLTSPPAQSAAGPLKPGDSRSFSNAVTLTYAGGGVIGVSVTGSSSSTYLSKQNIADFLQFAVDAGLLHIHGTVEVGQ